MARFCACSPLAFGAGTVRSDVQPGVLARYNGRKTVSVLARSATGDLGEAAAAVNRVVAELGELPRGVELAVRGQVQQVRTSLTGLLAGLGATIVVVLLLLTASFQAREGAVAPLELENARGSAAALEARVLALRELERELIVRAPFAGTVTQRGADQGALIGAAGDTALVNIADLSRLRLTVAVPERYARAAAHGARVPFRLEYDAPGTTREAVVSRTSGLLDSATRTLGVELDVDNSDDAILAGSFAEVMRPLDNGDEHPWVPATAIVQGSDGPCVWVVRENVLTKVRIHEVAREGSRVAVSAKLTKGESIITRGSEDFVEGAPVATGG